MSIESYKLIFKNQTQQGILLSDGDESFWFPKSQLEIHGIDTFSDYETLKKVKSLTFIFLIGWLKKRGCYENPQF